MLFTFSVLAMKNTRVVNMTRETSFSETCSSSFDFSTNLLYCILCFSFNTVTIILFIPYEQVNGSPVPAMIFKGLPSIFHSFLLSIVLAFSGSFNALMLAGNKPQIARFCSYYSMAFMASAIVLLTWAVFQTVIINLRSWQD